MSTFGFNYPTIKIDTNISTAVHVGPNTDQTIYTVPANKIGIITYLKVFHSTGSGQVYIKLDGQIIKTLTAGQTEIMLNLILGPGSNLKVQTAIGTGSESDVVAFGAQLKNADV